jgi:alcohol dehydrogenase class IV
MPKLIFGLRTSAQIGIHASGFGRCALLVTGAGSLARSGHLQRIQDRLLERGMQVSRWSIGGEPSPEMIDRAVRQTGNRNIDVVVAVGGGSVLDAGKAIAAMCKEPGSVIDYLEGVGSKTPSGRTLPVVAVPTTSGTGSEATKNAVLTSVGEKGFKKSLRHDNYVPKLALLDPALCMSAPRSVTAACGMDALTQLIESYISTEASVLTDALDVEGLRHLIPALPEACGAGADRPECHGALAYGAFLSGVTLAHAGLGVVHGIAGPMGGLVSIPHGVACANLLPSAIAHTVEGLAKGGDAVQSAVVLNKLARIGRLFGSTDKDPLDACRHLVARLYNGLDRLRIPRLRAFGMTVDLVERLIPSVSNKNNPSPLTDTQIRAVVLDRW